MKTFKEFHAGYVYYNTFAGYAKRRVDERILECAEILWGALKTPKKINDYLCADCEIRKKMVPGIEDKLGNISSFACPAMVHVAFDYAQYVEKLNLLSGIIQGVKNKKIEIGRHK